MTKTLTASHGHAFDVAVAERVNSTAGAPTAEKWKNAESEVRLEVLRARAAARQEVDQLSLWTANERATAVNILNRLADRIADVESLPCPYPGDSTWAFAWRAALRAAFDHTASALHDTVDELPLPLVEQP